MPAGTSAVHTHFIPTQLQRQQQNRNATNQQHLLKMGAFVPASSNVQSHHHPQSTGSFSGQVNYTVTPMSVPAVVHTLEAYPGTSTTTEDKKKSKKQDKGINNALFEIKTLLK